MRRTCGGERTVADMQAGNRTVCAAPRTRNNLDYPICTMLKMDTCPQSDDAPGPAKFRFVGCTKSRVVWGEFAVLGIIGSVYLYFS